MNAFALLWYKEEMVHTNTSPTHFICDGNCSHKYDQCGVVSFYLLFCVYHHGDVDDDGLVVFVVAIRFDTGNIYNINMWWKPKTIFIHFILNAIHNFMYRTFTN